MRKLRLLVLALAIMISAQGQTITAALNTVCPGGTRPLSITPAMPGGTIYQWLSGASFTVIPGATASTYNVTTAGTYYVHVYGAVTSDTLGPITITAASNPNSAFSYSPNSAQCGNKIYVFTGPSGSGLSYSWDFGDPNSLTNTSTVNPAVHAFEGNPGATTQNMQVGLTVTNADGCTSTSTNLITINQIPKAALTGPAAVNFQNLSYFKVCSLTPSVFTFNDATQPITNSSYQIIWGDATSPYTSITAPSGIQHTYNVGNYTLQYVVTGTNGCNDTTRYGVFVGLAPNGGIGTENPNLSGCTGATFSFPFLPSSFANPQGTFYTITVDDGSPVTTYDQSNLPPAFVHTFNTPSCNVNGTGLNYFTVSIKIQNPCNVIGIPGSIGGIQISEDPTADFSLSRDTVCVNQTVSATNQSSGTYINESGECVPGKSVWSVSPGTQGVDWIISSGNLGNQNSSNYASNWTAGSPTIQVNFITPGVYTIKVTAGGSDSCGLDIKTRNVCVNAVPTASFNANLSSPCKPVTATIQTAASTPTCGNNRYAWTINYSPAPGCTPAAAGYNFISGNVNSQNPVIQFTNPGTYTLQLIVTSPGGACSTSPITQTITVKDKATVNLGAINGICPNQSINPTATVSCYDSGGGYQWTFTGGNPGSSGATNPGSINYTNPGNYSVQLSVDNGCGPSFATQNFTVFNTITSNAGSSQTICGTSVVMNGNNPSPGTGTWTQVSGPNTATINNASSPTTSINNLQPGTYVFSWTISNNGCTHSSSVTVTVTPGPTAASAGPDIALCNASSATLAGNNPSSGTGTWTQVSGPAATITNVSQFNSTVTGLTPGVYVFRWTISNSSCAVSSDDVQISISAPASVASAGPNQLICGTTATLAANSPVVGTGFWTQTSGASAGINNPASPTSSVTGLSVGNYIFQWTITNGACSSQSTVNITISSGPSAANAGPDQSLCLATSTNLSANNPSTGNGTWSQVSGPPGASFSNINSNTSSVSNLQPGVYVFRWTISFQNCIPATDELTVTVNDNPTVANAGPAQTICAANTSLAGNTAVIGTGTWTEVSGPNLAAITSPGSSGTTITGLIPGVYVFRWTITNGTCPSTQSDVNITVTAIPTVANAGPDQSLCNVTTAVLAANTAVTGTGTWTQTGGPTVNLSNPSMPDAGISGLAAGTYNFQWTIANGVCPSTQDIVEIKVYDPATTADAGPDQTICGTTALMAANSAVIGSGTWSQLSGASVTITSPNSPTSTITGLAVGNYSFQWTITNGACSSTSNVDIVISSGPTAASAGPDQALCLSTTTTLTANTPVTGTGTWSQISGSPVTIVSPTQPGTSITGLTPGTYVFQWTISFSNCLPTTDQVEVIVYDNPTVANAGVDQNTCIPSVTLTGNIPAIGNGVWTQISGPGTANISTPASNMSTITSLIPGTYVFAWTISNGTCPSSSDEVTIVYSVLSNNTISGATQTCINTSPGTINGTVPQGSVGPYQYQWQISTDNGANWTDIVGANAIDYTVPVLTHSTCYRRQVSTSLCAGTEASPSNIICVDVKPDAEADFSASQLLLCAPVNLDTVISVNHLPLQNAQYNWYENGNLITGTTNGFPPSFVITNPGQTVVIKLLTISPYGCLSDSMEMSFNTRPAVVADFIKDTAAGCGPLAVQFTNTSSILNGTIEYYWNFGNGQTLSNVEQPALPILFDPSPVYRDTTYYITLQAFNGCDTVIKTDSVKIYAKPKALFFANGIGCSPFRDTIINTSLGQDAFTIYYWDFGDGTFDTTHTIGSIPHQYVTGVIDTFHIQLIMENRCSRDTAGLDVIVSPSYIQEHIAVNGTELYGCAPHTVNFQNSSTGASILYFDFGDGSPVEAVPNTQNVISHTFLTGGTFNIHITLENFCSDTSVDKTITVYDPPQAAFSILPNVICTGQSVTTNNSSLNGNSFEWFWGDNTSTAGFNATHFYNTAGVYTVKLVSRRVNAFGTVCTDTASNTVTVMDRVPAVIVVDPSIPSCAPYDMHVSSLNTASTSSIEWVFFDSQQTPGEFHVSGPSASHLFNQPGIDSVRLITTNLAGCKDSSSLVFTVNNTPAVLFTPFEIKTCNIDTIAQFTVDVNYNGTDPLQYEWYINDVISGNSNPFSYHFQAPGGITAINVFTVKVLIKNSAGCGDTAHIGDFVIQTLGPRNITVSPSMVQYQPNYSFTFTDSAEALPDATWLWDPGDRNHQTLPGQSINFTYGDTGVYHVSLWVQDYETGCQATDTISVYVLPVPGYLYVPNAFCPGCHKAELRQFLPLAKGLKDYHLVIYNIWGQKVFETRSLDANGVPNEPWNGNWPNGENLKQEAYSWFIEAHYINGTEWKGMLNPKTGKLEKKGFITIIR
jgi:PKD repeat protein